MLEQHYCVDRCYCSALRRVPPLTICDFCHGAAVSGVKQTLQRVHAYGHYTSGRSGWPEFTRCSRFPIHRGNCPLCRHIRCLNPSVHLVLCL